MSLSLNYNLLREFAYNNYFVETGTHTGGGVQIALDCGFKYIRSIELDKDFHDSARRTFSETPNVRLYLGDSSTDSFWKMIEDINEPVTFMLDAHLAAGDSRGSKEVPLLEELSFIKNHPVKTHTILIDDRRGFGYDPLIDRNLSKEWLSITEAAIIEKLKEINVDFSISYRDTNNATNDLLVARVE